MTTQAQRDLEVIRRYTDQPHRLPDELRPAIEVAVREQVRLYAMADRGPDLTLDESWLALTDQHVAAKWLAS